MPYRWSTSWRWQDDSHCPVSEITHAGFCQACEELGVTRILIMGDSLNIAFAMALKSLLGYSPKSRRGFGFNGQLQPTHISCPGSSQQQGPFQVRIWAYRRSPVTDFDSLIREAQNNQTKTSPQRLFVQDNPNRTVILANTGAWMRSATHYARAYKAVVDWIDSFPSDKILAVYRPSIPGHKHCLPGGTKDDEQAFNWSDPSNIIQESPYHNYSQYHDFLSQVPLEEDPERNWLDFEAWNQHSHEVLMNRSHNQTKIHWLNIFNSSVLRRDGHVGFGDCLHYNYGGPVDSWVHFFYSMLLDLANEE